MFSDTSILGRCDTILFKALALAKATPPFPQAGGGNLAEAQRELGGLENARLLPGRRLDLALVTEAVAQMPAPCRVVVSGPDGFNSAARAYLAAALPAEQVTVLSA